MGCHIFGKAHTNVHSGVRIEVLGSVQEDLQLEGLLLPPHQLECSLVHFAEPAHTLPDFSNTVFHGS